MEYKKRNGFFVFCFSFIPGAVEMYMGFMKNGVSIMAAFVLLFALATLGWSYFTYIFLGMAVVAWFYAFFHAWNMYRLDGETLVKMEDRYIWTEFGVTGKIDIEEKKLRKGVAIGLLIIGLMALYDIVKDIIYQFVPGDYWRITNSLVENVPVAVIFIFFGLKLIKNKKNDLEIDE
ncbi:hypothetical protein [Butyrivibrio sp. M55]|uniref:hypothetical protein n=1 Tax=Butyrivibrio sp. M55 TaxID=1855323 RepID=UPI0008E3AAD6|nr:hypothetical protein [Butyrivibrio sp. M55]SFU42923.1 hypothetical protein SAMN05216540_10273 [Butyrivibrio sp. M55]